jgi:hypothetical protein
MQWWIARRVVRDFGKGEKRALQIVKLGRYATQGYWAVARLTCSLNMSWLSKCLGAKRC